MGGNLLMYFSSSSIAIMPSVFIHLRQSHFSKDLPATLLQKYAGNSIPLALRQPSVVDDISDTVP